MSQKEISISGVRDGNVEMGKKKKKISIPYGTMKKL